MESLADGVRFERVLVVGAHPDDAEFYGGGTLARFADDGASVSLVVCTDGGRGGRDGLGPEEMARVRHAEQERAAKAIGVAEVIRLGRPDGELVCDDALREALVRAVRQVRPELVLTHDPTTLWRVYGDVARLGHTDHRATGQGVLDALYPRARSPNFFPDQIQRDGLQTWYPDALWLFDSEHADLQVDITATLERKLESLRAHHSQARSGGGMIEAARALATSTGSPERPAEAFRALRLRRRSPTPG